MSECYLPISRSNGFHGLKQRQMNRTELHVLCHSRLQRLQVERLGEGRVMRDIGHHAAAVLLGEVQHPVHQVAQRISQLGVVHRDQRLLGEVQVRAVSSCCAEIIANRIHRKLVQNLYEVKICIM